MLILLTIICTLPILWVIISLLPLHREKGISDMLHARTVRR